MPDTERITDSLRVHLAKHGIKAKGKSSDYWDGFRKGKSRARIEVAVIFAIIYFGVAAIGHLSNN